MTKIKVFKKETTKLNENTVLYNEQEYYIYEFDLNNPNILILILKKEFDEEQEETLSFMDNIDKLLTKTKLIS